MTASRQSRLEQRLRKNLDPQELEITDDSHLHAGHAGAADGRGHFSVRIVSKKFEGLQMVKRHRLIYEAVGDMMQTDVHALSIQAITPAESTSS